nr:hypothetical protein [Gardnerella vaginalis]
MGEAIEKVLNNVNARELYVLDMGPGEVLGKLTNVLLQGSGAGVVEVGTMNARAKASTTSAAEAELLRTGCWEDFAPRVIDTPAGKKVVTNSAS